MRRTDTQRKKFLAGLAEGQRVRVRRDTWGDLEGGRYLGEVHDMHGWHVVKSDNGIDRLVVPTRRLFPPEG